MAIEGTYGFVYSGVNGLGLGIFTVLAEKFEGVDFVGGRYTGIARENRDGTISLSIDFDVKPGMAPARSPPSPYPTRNASRIRKRKGR
jgi:hypothetical protein